MNWLPCFCQMFIKGIFVNTSQGKIKLHICKERKLNRCLATIIADKSKWNHFSKNKNKLFHYTVLWLFSIVNIYRVYVRTSYSFFPIFDVFSIQNLYKIIFSANNYGFNQPYYWMNNRNLCIYQTYELVTVFFLHVYKKIFLSLCL